MGKAVWFLGKPTWTVTTRRHSSRVERGPETRSHDAVALAVRRATARRAATWCNRTVDSGPSVVHHNRVPGEDGLPLRVSSTVPWVGMNIAEYQTFKGHSGFPALTTSGAYPKFWLSQPLLVWIPHRDVKRWPKRREHLVRRTVATCRLVLPLRSPLRTVRSPG